MKKKKKNTIIVIPRYMVTVRFIDIPSIDDAEIAKMVEFQAVKEIPYSKEEMIIGYRNLGSFKEGFSSAMIVILKKEIANEKINEMAIEGFKVENIRLYSELLYLFLLKKGVIKQEKVALIIHITKSDSEIMVVDRTRPIFSRGFENNDRLQDEIKRSLLVYERDRNNPVIQEVVLTHPYDTDIVDIESYLKEAFDIPVIVSDYSEDLSKLDLAAEIVLLPREIGDIKLKLQKKYELLTTYSLIACVLILFSAFLFFKIYEKKRFLEVISSKMTYMSSEMERLGRFVKKTEIAKEDSKHGKFIKAIFEGSYKLIPADITLLGFNYDGKRTVSYKGDSEDMSAIFAFVTALENSEFFEKVEVKYAAKKKIRGKEFTNFDIQCHIAPEMFSSYD